MKYVGEGSVLISSIQNFDDLASRTTPEDLVKFLNQHLDVQLGVVEEFSGSVVQFAGSRIIAYWTSEQTKEHSQLAFSSARKMLSVAEPSVEYCVVVSSGRMVADLFGGGDWIQFQIFGEAMDIANRLLKYPIDSHKALLTSKKTVQGFGNSELKVSLVGTANGTLEVYSVSI